jgi:hypothetical protein
VKWFRHMSNMSQDEFIAELEHIYGLEGYARWCKLLEAIADQMDKTARCSVSYPWSKWQTILRGKRNKLETFLKHLENKRKIFLNENGNVLEIGCRKLLELRDEYSRKSGQTPDRCPDKVAPDTDTEVDKRKKEIQKKKRKEPDLEKQVALIWKEYPRKDHQKAGYAKIKARINARADPNLLLKAAINYSQLVKKEKRIRQHILLGSTFFGPNEPWLDYIHKQIKCVGCGKEVQETEIDYGHCTECRK